MLELYIDNKPIDLTGSETISIDLGIYSIDDINTRRGSFSVEFGLPKTTNNQAHLESPDFVNNLSRKPYTKLAARLFVDGIDVNIRLCTLQMSNDFYRVRLFGENPNFFESAKKVKLENLSMCQYDHFWTIGNVVAALPNTDGYLYPLIDYRQDSPDSDINNTDREINVKYMLPAVYKHSVFEAIAREFNITIYNQVETTTRYPVDMLIEPFNRSRLVRNTLPERYEVIFSQSVDALLTHQAPGYPSPILPSPGVFIDFDTVSNNCGAYWNHGNFTEYLRFAEKIRFTVEYDISLTDGPGLPLLGNLYMLTNYTAPYDPAERTPLNILEQPFDILPGGVYTRVTGSYTFETQPSYLKDNAFFMWLSGGFAGLTKIKGGSFIKITAVEILEQVDVVYEATETQQNYVTVSSVLPNWNCAQFIKNYCNQFNALPIFENNTLKIVPFNKIKENIISVVDWSAKLDLTTEPEIEFSLEKLAQINTLAYEVDETVTKPDGTDGTIEIDNENLVAEAELVMLDYAATESVLRLIDVSIPQIKAFTASNLLSGTGTPRCLILERQTLSPGVDFTDGATTTTVAADLPIPYFIKDGAVFNYGFADNLLDDYYDLTISIMDYVKVVRPLIRLNAVDINQLDFLKPVYIEYFNSYFYINKISGYEPGGNESTKVELVKLF